MKLKKTPSEREKKRKIREVESDVGEGEGVGRDGVEMRGPRGRLIGFLGEEAAGA